MTNVLPITQVRAQLPSLVEDAEVLYKRTLISVKGKVRAALISARELEDMEDTLEILSDTKTMKTLKQGLNDVKHGRLVSWETVKKRLDLP